VEYFCSVNIRHCNSHDCDGNTRRYLLVWNGAKVHSDFLLHDQPNVYFLPCQPLDRSWLPRWTGDWR